MADLLIRDIDAGSKALLVARAARNGRSQQAEARLILESALAEEKRSWVSALRLAAEKSSGIDLPDVPRHKARETSTEGWL
ncbi:MAG: hypothetical protein IJC51_02680 [Eggerthellaceae bacterium]|nr:hypothetical protein [Eggerthellaceae bacterium]